MYRALDEAACRTILEVVPGHLILTTVDGRIRHINRAPMAQRPSHYVNRYLADCIADEHRSLVEDAISQLSACTTATEFEAKWAETERWYRIRMGAIAEQNRVTGFIINLLDIDEEKRNEAERRRLLARVHGMEPIDAELQRSDDPQRLLDLMADSLPFLISYVDSQHRYQYNNAAYERWFETPRETIQGRTIEEVLGTEAYQRIRAYVEAALGGQAVRFEIMLPYKNAGMRQVVAHYVPDTLPSGKIGGFYALIEDVSERRESEQALLQKQEEIRQLQKMEALGRLAGGIAHEFGNLLQVVIVSCESVLKAVDENSIIGRHAASVNRAAQRGTSLTRQLLSFSRQAEPSVSAIDFDALVGDMAILLEPLLDSNVALEVDLHASCEIEADAGQIQQVLMNLAINAGDAMPDGGQLRIETRKVDISADEARAHVSLEAGIYVQLTVADTGTGMDEATRARIFDPFFTTKAVGKGTGLGLSTVYGIAQQLGGQIDVNSKPGEGTKFRIYLPCKDLPQEGQRT